MLLLCFFSIFSFSTSTASSPSPSIFLSFSSPLVLLTCWFYFDFTFFDAAIAALKEREPGSFLIRDSNSFQGAYGLALKVATPPTNINNHNSKGKKKNETKKIPSPPFETCFIDAT